MSAQPKELVQVRARAGRTDRNYHSGLVELSALPAWLKSDALAIAKLTPLAAMELASELLNAALQAKKFAVENESR